MRRPACLLRIAPKSRRRIALGQVIEHGSRPVGTRISIAVPGQATQPQTVPLVAAPRILAPKER
jgi:hypothetical protein